MCIFIIIIQQFILQEHNENNFRKFISNDYTIPASQNINNTNQNQVNHAVNINPSLVNSQTTQNKNNKLTNEFVENLEKNLNEKSKKLVELEKKLKEESEKNKYLESRLKELEEEIKLLKKNEKSLKYEISLNIDSKNKKTVLEALIKKDEEIENLKKKLTRFPFILEEGEKLMHINITNTDFNIQNYSIICKNTDKFNQIENKIYDEFTELKDIQTYFIFNGKVIEKYKSLEENGIGDNEVIVMYKVSTDDD